MKWFILLVDICLQVMALPAVTVLLREMFRVMFTTRYARQWDRPYNTVLGFLCPAYISQLVL